MKQYKIWNRVFTRGGRKSSCDFGANEKVEQTIYVGTSSRNSHQFADVTMECTPHPQGLGFSLYINNALVQSGVVQEKELVPFEDTLAQTRDVIERLLVDEPVPSVELRNILVKLNGA